MPVEGLAPKMSAKTGTTIVPSPLMPVLDMPMHKLHTITTHHSHADKGNMIKNSFKTTFFGKRGYT